MNRLYRLDALEFLQNQVEARELDGVFTDPPYPMDDLMNFGDSYTLVDWDYLQHVIFQLKVKLKVNAPLFWMSNLSNFRKTWETLENQGFQVLNVIVWNKAPAGFSGHIAPGRNFLNACEFVFYAVNEEAEYIQPVQNLFNYIGKIPSHKLGPTTKPAQLVAHCLRSFDHLNATFCDPFAGSNPLLRAINMNYLQGNSITNALVTGEEDPAMHSPDPEIGLFSRSWIQ